MCTHEVYSWSVTRAADQVVVASGSLHDDQAAKNNCDAIMAQVAREKKFPADTPVSLEYPGILVGAIRDQSEIFLVCAVGSYPGSSMKSCVKKFMQKFNNVHGKPAIQSANVRGLNKKNKAQEEIKTFMAMWQDPKHQDIVQKNLDLQEKNKSVLEDAIDSAIQRNNVLDEVEDSSLELVDSAKQFKESSVDVRRTACRKQWTMYIAGFLVFAVIIIIVLAALGVFNSSDD
jgi:hypothetical protein